MDKNKATEFSTTDLEEAAQLNQLLPDRSLASKNVSNLAKIYVSEIPMELVDPMAEEITKEIEKYSITPETLRSKKFDGKESVKLKSTLEQELAMINENIHTIETRGATFKEKAERTINELKELSFGIVEGGEFAKSEKEILDFNERFFSNSGMLTSYAQELDKYLSFVERNQNLFLSFVEEYGSSSSQVTRFGINTANMKPAQIKELTSISYPMEEKRGQPKSKGSKSSTSKDDQEALLPILHPLETILIRDAIKHCKAQNQKTILIDIFARKEDGTIKMEEEAGKPEVHTIVLYLQAEANKLLVIDPSNSDFSRHLATKININRIFGSNEEKMGIIVRPKSFKIYASHDKDKVGPNPDQYRDCTDIAVKLAFSLSEIQSIDIMKLESLEEVRTIANQITVNPYLFFNSSEATARIRQSSDSIVRKEVNKLIMSIDKQIKSAEQLNRELSRTIYENTMSAFNNPDYGPDYYFEGIRELFVSYTENNTFIKISMEELETKLAGELSIINITGDL